MDLPNGIDVTGLTDFSLPIKRIEIMKKFISLYSFRIFWIPFFIACLCGLLALCKVGYPAEWQWWAFPLVAFGPTIALFLIAVVEAVVFTDIPPMDDDGGYYFHQVECGLMKPRRVFVLSRKAFRYRNWYLKTLYPMREGRKQ